MYGNWPNYKLMQQKHTVCSRYQNSYNWYERLGEHCQNLEFIKNLASDVSVTRL